MPYFVDKKKRTGRDTPRTCFSTGDIDVTRRVALGLIDEMVGILADRMTRITNRRDKGALRAIARMRKLFRDAAAGTDLPQAEVLQDVINEVFDTVEAVGSRRHLPGPIESSLTVMEDFLAGSRGGYTPEMLAIVLADLFRQHAMIEASRTTLWFLSALRPDQLWAKPQRGFPRQMLARDDSGRTYSPAALHWVRSCTNTAAGF